jgi:hypothetical protein
MIVENKISTKNKIISSKIWYGNPQIELTEGNITYEKIIYTINSQNGNNNSSIISISDFTNQSDIFSDLNESELEFIKQYIWEQNIKNNLINSSELACINIPNKISINEFLASISIYLSYINTIRVLKSPIPNIYFIYLEMKNKEFSNIFFNTFNYSKINPIEKEYLIFGEVKEINFERGGDSFKTKRKSPKNQNYTSSQCQNLNLKNITNQNTCTLSPQNSNSIIIDISVSNSDQNEEIENIVCPICLEHIDEKSQTQNNFNQKK